MFVFESGNVAAATGVKLARAQVIAAYPITPQTPLTEKLSVFVDAGELDAEYVAVESEHSALAVCIGATSTGARAFTATSANGLLYMSEQVHWTAGARLPMVMCVVNRGVGAPWSVWNDHQDSISQRDAGWIQIYAKDHQEIIDTVIKAYRLTEEVCIPVMVCYDGYYLSHTYMPFEVPEQEQVDAFLPPYEYRHTARSREPDQPEHGDPSRRTTGHRRQPLPRGTWRSGAVSTWSSDEAIEVYARIDSEFKAMFGRGGNPIAERYLCDDAEYVAVALGSMSNQIKDAVDELREEGIRGGSARPLPVPSLPERVHRLGALRTKGRGRVREGAQPRELRRALRRHPRRALRVLVPALPPELHPGSRGKELQDLRFLRRDAGIRRDRVGAVPIIPAGSA